MELFALQLELNSGDGCLKDSSLAKIKRQEHEPPFCATKKFQPTDANRAVMSIRLGQWLRRRGLPEIAAAPRAARNWLCGTHAATPQAMAP